MDKKILLFLLIIVIVLISGIFLAGYLNNNDEKLDEVENKLEIINPNGESKDVETPDSTVDEDDSTDVDSDKPEEDSDVEEDDEEAVVVVEGTTYTGATTADNVRITKYNYYYEAGQLVFEWTFKSDNADKKIASYTTGYDSSDNFVVTFGSVNKDYVATEEKDIPLGNLLPLLKVKPDGTKSEYRFMVEKKTDSKFEINGDMLILKLDLK